MQDLNDMYLFAKVVEHGGFSAAARALGLQTSKLSRRIADLEERLGVRLLQRTTRSISVTDIGQNYYLHCAALGAEAQAAQETIDRTRSQPQGLVHVACPPGLLNGGPMVQVASRFLVDYPLVQLRIEASNRRVEVVEEGFDVALRVRTLPLEDSDLAVRTLGRSGLTLVASPLLLAREGTPTKLEELPRFSTISMARAGDRHVWEFRDQAGATITVTHTPRLMTDDFALLHQAAVDGVGIAYLPKLIVMADLASGVLEHVLPQFSLPEALVHMVFPSRRGMVPAVRAFIDATVAGFNDSDCQGE